MTQPIDTERPHEFMQVGEPRNPKLPADYCVLIDGDGYCGQPRAAAVHQVAKCVNHCAHKYGWMVQGELGLPRCKALIGPNFQECNHVCTFAPAEVHQEPESQLTPSEIAKGFAGVRRRASDLAAARKGSTPPDQHVAPPRIFALTPPFQTGGGKRYGNYWTEQTDVNNLTEYLCAAPIQSALENCADCGDFEDAVVIYKSSWDVLVAAIK